MYRHAEEKLKSWYAGSRRKPLVRRFSDTEGISLYEVNLEKHRVLDTVFATPDLDTIIRELQVVAGSLMKFALSSHSFAMPVGRVEYFRMGPVRFTEYLNAIDPDLTHPS